MKPFIIFLFILFNSCAQHDIAINNKPDQLADGIQTSTLTGEGMNEKLINAMQDSII